MPMVARPRFHPRASNLFTPGSMANAKKREMSNKIKRFVRRLMEWRVATITRNPTQKMAAARISHRVEPMRFFSDWGMFSSPGDDISEAYAVKISPWHPLSSPNALNRYVNSLRTIFASAWWAPIAPPRLKTSCLPPARAGLPPIALSIAFMAMPQCSLVACGQCSFSRCTPLPWQGWLFIPITKPTRGAACSAPPTF